MRYCQQFDVRLSVSLLVLPLFLELSSIDKRCGGEEVGKTGMTGV